MNECLRGVAGSYSQGDKIGLVGANGQGKSTLVKVMLGELRPKSGSAGQHPQARIGMFAQSNVEDLVQGKGQLTALKHMKALYPDGNSPLTKTPAAHGSCHAYQRSTFPLMWYHHSAMQPSKPATVLIACLCSDNWCGCVCSQGARPQRPPGLLWPQGSAGHK